MINLLSETRINLIKAIYRMAKTKDVNAIEQLTESSDYQSVLQLEENPVTLLAKEGDWESLDFLFNHFFGN